MGRKAAKNVGGGFALEDANRKTSRVRPSEKWGSVGWGNPVIGNKRAEGAHEQKYRCGENAGTNRGEREGIERMV